MNNSSLLSNSRSQNVNILESLLAVMVVCGLLLTLAVAVASIVVWQSPLLFFTSVSGLLLCIDALRK